MAAMARLGSAVASPVFFTCLTTLAAVSYYESKKTLEDLHMFKTINGWTKAKMRAVVEARPFDDPSKENLTCKYLSSDGNKCAVGLFIPDGHEAQGTTAMIGELLHRYPDLWPSMPLEIDGLAKFQSAHDMETYFDNRFGGNAKAAMLDFIDTQVSDG